MQRTIMATGLSGLQTAVLMIIPDLSTTGSDAHTIQVLAVIIIIPELSQQAPLSTHHTHQEEMRSWVVEVPIMGQLLTVHGAINHMMEHREIQIQLPGMQNISILRETFTGISLAAM